MPCTPPGCALGKPARLPPSAPPQLTGHCAGVENTLRAALRARGSDRRPRVRGGGAVQGRRRP
eukprot:837731-Prymnesium_polylepis.1